MKIKYKIIDNFISKKDLKNINEIVMGSNFPWFFQNKINYNHSEEDNYFYLTHLIYINNTINSSYYDLFSPILNKLKIKSLIRIKVNFYPHTPKIIENKPHKDYEFKHKGCIFYFNSCNGYTKLKDNTKIDSIENRALFFDPSINHQSTTCTNTKARFNMNINYI